MKFELTMTNWQSNFSIFANSNYRHMSRVKLSMPEKIIFSTNYLIGIGDINYGNHVGNDRVLTIAHNARLEFLKSLGFKDELSFGDGVGLIQTDAEVVYKAEAVHGDKLIITIGIDEVHRYGLEFYYQISKEESEVIVALVKTGIMFYNYSGKHPVEIPAIAKSKLSI